MEVAMPQLLVISVQFDVDDIAEPRQAHDDEQFEEEQQLRLRVVRHSVVARAGL